MPKARDLLQRFRPVGTPGAAAPAGVPVDWVAELSAELEPVFAALSAVEAAAEAVRREALTEAVRRRDGAAAEAQQIVAAARRGAEDERRGVAERRRREAQQEVGRLLAVAAAEAERVRGVAAGRMSELTARVVAQARALAAGVAPVADPVPPAGMPPQPAG